MAVWTDFSFTKHWTNKVDFPTYEESEDKVRADYQELHNQTRDFINTTLKAYITDITISGVADGSVTKAKLANSLISTSVTSASTNDTLTPTKAMYDFVEAYVEAHAPVGGGWVASDTAPTDTTVLWIDTSGSTGGLKYYDAVELEWRHCPVAYAETQEETE